MTTSATTVRAYIPAGTNVTVIYNFRRYGGPWIALVTEWPVGKRPELAWGSYTGTNIEEGELEVEARPGDIVRWGQKDHRMPHKSFSFWGIVQEDGSVQQCTETEAAHAFRSQS